MSTVPIKSNYRKCKQDCYILHRYLSVIILLLLIAIICYNYTKRSSKQKFIGALTIKNWSIMN